MIMSNVELKSVQDAATWVLAQNQKHRGSELHAGARAELLPSPLTRSLATWRGQLMARTMRLMGVEHGILNYAAFRPYAIMEIIRQYVAKIPAKNPVVLDPAAGYGPEHLWLAEELPAVQFIELDHPDVIADKEKRLNRYPIPANLRLIGADLSEQSLDIALGNICPDIVIVIAAYVSTADYMNLLRYLPQIMRPNGWVIAPFPYKPGIDNLFVNRLTFQDLVKVGPVGMVDSEAAIHDIMAEVNYRHTQIFTLSTLARQMGKPIPSNVEIMAVAQIPSLSIDPAALRS